MYDRRDLRNHHLPGKFISTWTSNRGSLAFVRQPGQVQGVQAPSLICFECWLLTRHLAEPPVSRWYNMVNLESKLEALGLFSRTSPSPTGEAMSKRSYLRPGEKEGARGERKAEERRGEKRRQLCGRTFMSLRLQKGPLPTHSFP